MPRHDLANRHLPVRIIDPGTYASDPTVQGQARLNDAESVFFAVLVGSYSDGTHEFTVEEAANDGNGNPDTWSAVSGDDVVAHTAQDLLTEASPFLTVDAAADDSNVYVVSYIGSEPFARVVQAVSGATTGLESAVTALKGDLRRQT